ncbi:MAG TPA: hypothetical protein VG965_01285 [Patescibacteria group bacterium]|nr:hypothetical protein [Patescibacteria group bacterium]
MSVSEGISHAHKDSDPIQPRDFSRIEDDKLKNRLNSVQKLLPPDQKEFTNYELSIYLAAINTSHPSDLNRWLGYLLKQKTIPYISEMHGQRNRMSWTREGVYAVVAFDMAKKMNRDWENATIDALDAVGEDPLKDMLLYPPDPSRRFDEKYYRTAEVKPTRERILVLSDPKRIEDVDMQTGEFWQSNLGTKYRDLLEQNFGKLSDPLTPAQIAVAFRLDDHAAKNIVISLANSGFLAEAALGSNRKLLRVEHFAILGLYFAHQFDGSQTPEKTVEVVTELLRGTSLEKYIGTPRENSIRKSWIGDTSRSPLNQLPIEHELTEGAEDDAENEGKEREVKTLSPKELVNSIPNEYIEAVMKFDLAAMAALRRSIPGIRFETVSAARTPIGVPYTAIVIESLLKGVYKNPDELIPNMTYAELDSALITSMRSLEKNPKVRTLGRLFLALKQRVNKIYDENEKAEEAKAK